jgi:hypothetical protein
MMASLAPFIALRRGPLNTPECDLPVEVLGFRWLDSHFFPPASRQ